MKTSKMGDKIFAELYLSECRMQVFDFFDLFVRTVYDNLTNLYMLLSSQYKDPDFSKIRILSQNNLEENGRDFDIFDVYVEMKKFIALSPYESALREMDLIEKFCYIDDKFRELVLSEYNEEIKLIVLNDTIYPNWWIKTVIKKLSGLDKFEVFDGRISDFCSLNWNNKLRINYMCKKCNQKLGESLLGKRHVNAIEYNKINTLPVMDKDTFGISPLINLAYNSVVKRRPKTEESFAYNFGYNYGGIYAIGFTSWILDICQKEQIDKVIFLARDGYSLFKVFQMLYKDFPSSYAMWSRSVAARSCCDIFPYYFISNIFYSRRKIKFACTVLDMLKYLGIDYISKNELRKYSLEPGTEIGTENIDNYDRFIAFAIEHMAEIISQLTNERDAAKFYYNSLVGDSKKVAIVDTGWSGSNILVLKHAIEKEWVPGCKVVPLMAGMLPRFLQACPSQIIDQRILTYMFSPITNPHLMYELSKFKFAPIFFELFSAAQEPTVLKIKKDQFDAITFEFDEIEGKNADINADILRGIIDFAKEYMVKFCDGYQFLYKIPGSDVGLIAKSALADYDFLRKTFADFDNYINLGLPTHMKNNYPIINNIY